MVRLLRFFMIFITVLLTACTNLQVAQEQSRFIVESPTARAAGLQKITRWNISGAMSVARAGKVNIVSFSWQQNAASYRIRLSATLNLASMVIIGKPGYVTLIKGDHMYHAASPESLLRTRANLAIPVSDLQFWIRSLPAPGQPYQAKYDDYGHLIYLQQAGWQVQFSDFLTVGGVDVPQKLMMTYPGLKVRIVIKQWQLH